ncbi:hypothetical protein DES34_12613 [Brevibacillus brevis]|nr:hypothetical protein DES34_12613 [Brevibacillus brevis]VEF92013.1 Uncharacterised protein [Brevibacillus brevis]
MQKLLLVFALVVFFSSPVVSEAYDPTSEPYRVEPDW